MDKNYVFFHDSDTNHYTAEIFVVRCFDDRFWKAFKRFMQRSGFFDNIDAEAVAGGAKVFSSPEKEEDRDFMLRELEKSIRLHHTKKVMLFTHSDCGAYGGITKFGSAPEKEFEFHVNEHKKALEAIRAKFPELEIETYFIDDKGIIKTF